MIRKIVKVREDGTVKLNLNPYQLDVIVRLLAEVQLGNDDVYTQAAFELSDALEREGFSFLSVEDFISLKYKKDEDGVKYLRLNEV